MDTVGSLQNWTITDGNADEIDRQSDQRLSRAETGLTPEDLLSLGAGMVLAPSAAAQGGDPALSGTLVVQTVSGGPIYAVDADGSHLRYLSTGHKVVDENWELAFAFNPDPGDDGWWIDDIQVDSALSTPAVFTVDSKPNAALPACGLACTSLSAGCGVTARS